MTQSNKPNMPYKLLQQLPDNTARLFYDHSAHWANADGMMKKTPYTRTATRPNEQCACKSGKSHKRCCGKEYHV
jgi:uncharacterized protein YchJ